LQSLPGNVNGNAKHGRIDQNYYQNRSCKCPDEAIFKVKPTAAEVKLAFSREIM